MALINAYRRDTGEKVLIPERWIGHRVLGKPFRKTPLQRAADDAATTTSADAAATTTRKSTNESSAQADKKG